MSLRGERVLITGANGSIGQALIPRLDDDGVSFLATDVDTFDVRGEPPPSVLKLNPTLVIHLAADKHAPNGEQDPWETLRVNADGTANVLRLFPAAKVVLTSTCKAADPETAYGASKLIAERMVLNAGGVVARLYNVIEASGNVFELWRSIPADKPITVTPCRRYFITIDQAVDLVLECCKLPAGRYTIDPGRSRWMDEVARELYPGREIQYVLPRRGDRKEEPLMAASETYGWVRDDGLRSIESPHDPVPCES